MRVYFQLDDSEEWLAGELVSMSGGRLVNVVSRDGDGKIVKQITMSNSETLFYNSGFSVTGYMQTGDLISGLYKLVSIDFRLMKPRKKKGNVQRSPQV